jgi:hypothetical protein
MKTYRTIFSPGFVGHDVPRTFGWSVQALGGRGDSTMPYALFEPSETAK